MNLKGDAYFEQKENEYCNTEEKEKEKVQLIHAMVVTGFVLQDADTPEHLILLNSYGPHWGNNGFFRYVKSDENLRPYSYITQFYATIKELLFQKESDNYINRIPLNPKGIYVVSSKASGDFLAKLGNLGKTTKPK
jgi:aminopeptidase C